MPAKVPRASTPNTINPALEVVACTALAAPVDWLAAAEPLALALRLADPLAVPLALVDCADEALLRLAVWVPFPISALAGLHTTYCTLLLKHSPSSWKVWPSLGVHCAEHRKGLPKAFMSPPLQHAYKSQKA